MKLKLSYFHLEENIDEASLKLFDEGLKPFGWSVMGNQDITIDLSTLDDVWEFMNNIEAGFEGERPGLKKRKSKYDHDYCAKYGIVNSYAFDALYLDFYSVLCIITKVYKKTNNLNDMHRL